MGSGDLEAELAAGLGSGGSLSMIYCFLCSTVKLEVGSSIPIGFSNLAIFNLYFILAYKIYLGSNKVS